jgi:hypothetical protein
MLWQEAFLPDLLILPEMNSADVDAEIQRQFSYQRAMNRFLKGEINFDELVDFAIQLGIDPDDYLLAVMEAVDNIVDSGTQIENLDSAIELIHY